MDVDLGLLRMLVFLVAVAAVIVLIIRFLVPLVGEMIFRLSLHFMKPEKSVVKAYLRLLAKSRKAGMKYEPTPREYAEILSKKGCDIGAFVSILERYEYSDQLILSNKEIKKSETKTIAESYRKATRVAYSKKRT